MTRPALVLSSSQLHRSLFRRLSRPSAKLPLSSRRLSRCSDRKNYRAVFGRSSTETIKRARCNDETRLIRDLPTEKKKLAISDEFLFVGSSV